MNLITAARAVLKLHEDWLPNPTSTHDWKIKMALDRLRKAVEKEELEQVAIRDRHNAECPRADGRVEG